RRRRRKTARVVVSASRAREEWLRWILDRFQLPPARPTAVASYTYDTSFGMMKTPPSASLRVKRKNVRQIRKHFCLSRANGQDPDGSLWKIQPGQRDVHFTKMPTTVIQRQEMASYLHLFGE
ncbi:hypothetical protein CHARACLAT_004789, partial [Characodon lateralis]|nr:hypothetical protein [Characodon lateralis]